MSTDIWLLTAEIAAWSDRTFGAGRDGVGAAKHLIEEAGEAAENPDDILEWADCLMLVLDGARRQGFTVNELLAATRTKLAINKKRKWKIRDDLAYGKHE